MADYNSKYTGEQVEEFLDQIANGELGGIVSETDPIFSASPAASITEEKKTEWDNKQDAIADLDTIRSGAEKGATALQYVPSEYVTESRLMWIKADGEAGVRLKGTNGTAIGNFAISAGDDKTASDGTAFASTASGDHAVVFGYGNTCAGRSTLAQGLYNIVNGKDSVAFGQRNTVNGDQAFAAGQQNEVTTRLGVAIGYNNKTTNTDSIAIGYKNTSSGSASVAMGDTCEANGTSSTAMGYNTKATGAYSSTFGQNTQATNNGEVAMGLYNKSTTSTDASEQTLFSFGIGTSDTNRANAFEIKKNGDVYIGDKILSGGGITTETDPIFSASPAASITEEKKTEWDTKQDKIEDLDVIREGAGLGTTALQFVPAEYVTETELINKGYATTSALNDKVDKVSGKQLTTEDFTTALKTKLEGLNNYDDTEISNAISSLQTQLNTLVSGNANDAINSFNEIIAFLDGIKDTQDLSSIIASIEQQIASKQATISDLDTIRTGASLGATALQSYTEKYTGTYSKPSGGIPKTDLASSVQTSLDKADTALQSYTEQYKGTVTGVKINNATKNPSNGVVDLGTVITSHQDISGKADKSSLATVATSGSYNDLSNKPTIPAEQVNADWNATSGKAQILNKPTIPSAVTESTVSGWGFTKNTGTYSKPSTGIPKTDLASAVQTSLGKADTALQSYTEQYKGTITGVSANGTSVATSGVANIPAATTSKYGVTQLSSSTSSTSTSLAATPSAVKSAYDLANGKQDKLVSGTNIKTINGTSILGSGDITISGGSSGGGGDSYAGNYPLQIFNTYTSTITLQPNIYNRYETSFSGDMTIQLASPSNTSIVNEYIIEFYCGITRPYSFPSSVVWANDDIPDIEAGYTYVISIVNNVATYIKTKNKLFTETSGG